MNPTEQSRGDGQCFKEQFTPYLLKGELGFSTDERRNTKDHTSNCKISAEQTNERSDMSCESTK